MVSARTDEFDLLGYFKVSIPDPPVSPHRSNPTNTHEITLKSSLSGAQEPLTKERCNSISNLPTTSRRRYHCQENSSPEMSNGTVQSDTNKLRGVERTNKSQKDNNNDEQNGDVPTKQHQVQEIEKMDPNLGKVVYEIHDVDLVCNYAENVKAQKLKAEEETKELKEIKKFYSEQDEKNHQKIQQQQEELTRRRKDVREKLKADIRGRTELLEHNKTEERRNKEHLRDLFKTIDSQIQQEEERKREAKRQNQALIRSHMESHQKKKAQQLKEQKEWESQQSNNTSIGPLFNSPVPSIELRSAMHKINAQEQDRQIQLKRELTVAKRTKEMEEERKSLETNQIWINQQKQLANREREALHQLLHSEWEQAMKEAQKKRENQQDERKTELNHREQQEQKNELARQILLRKRAENRMERNREMNEQIQAAEAKKSEMKNEKRKDKEIAEKCNSMEVRRILFRCRETGKILSPEQFNIMDARMSKYNTQ